MRARDNYRIPPSCLGLDETRMAERLQQQVLVLKRELRAARAMLDRQAGMISEVTVPPRSSTVPLVQMRDCGRACQHPSSLTLFVLACVSLFICVMLLNKMMRGSVYLDAVNSLS